MNLALLLIIITECRNNRQAVLREWPSPARVGFLIPYKENGAMHTALQTTFIKVPPKFLDPVRYVFRTKHCNCATEKPYVGWLEYSNRFHKLTPTQEYLPIMEAV